MQKVLLPFLDCGNAFSARMPIFWYKDKIVISPHTVYLSMNKIWRLTCESIIYNNSFLNMEAAKKFLDSLLIERGYKLLTEEQINKLEILL